MSTLADHSATVWSDIVVVGGGPAGVAVAASVAKAGASTLLIEKSHYQGLRVGETFPPAIHAALQHLGLRGCLAGDTHLRSVGIQSFWGSDAPTDRSFLFDPYGDGWHVDRRQFDASLADAVEGMGVRVARGHRILACQAEGPNHWRLQLKSSDGLSEVDAGFLVDATGRQSWLARRFGATRVATDRLVAAVALGRPTKPGKPCYLQPVALIESAAGGWWYSAPQPGGFLIVVCVTDAALCTRQQLRALGAWTTARRGAPHTDCRSADFVFEDGVKVVTANNSYLDAPCGRRWLAVGDAASAHDPLSGNGVYRALTMGARAATVVLAACSGDRNAGPEYHQSVRHDYQTHLARAEQFYGRERRWPDAPFWSARGGDRLVM